MSTLTSSAHGEGPEHGRGNYVVNKEEGAVRVCSSLQQRAAAWNMAPPTLTSFLRNEPYKMCCTHVHVSVNLICL